MYFLYFIFSLIFLSVIYSGFLHYLEVEHAYKTFWKLKGCKTKPIFLRSAFLSLSLVSGAQSLFSAP